MTAPAGGFKASDTHRTPKKQWEGHTVMADDGHLNAVGARIVGFVVLEAVGAPTIPEAGPEAAAATQIWTSPQRRR